MASRVKLKRPDRHSTEDRFHRERRIDPLVCGEHVEGPHHIPSIHTLALALDQALLGPGRFQLLTLARALLARYALRCSSALLQAINHLMLCILRH